MTDTTPVTPAQELITISMLGALLVCAVANYALLTLLDITSIAGYATLIIATFITTGYVVPNLTAHWIGRPLDTILDDDTTLEATLDTEHSSD